MGTGRNPFSDQSRAVEVADKISSSGRQKCQTLMNIVIQRN